VGHKEGGEVKRVLLIDADILVYQVATAAEVPVKWEDDLWTLHSYEEPAKEKLDFRIAEVMKALFADEVILCLTTLTRNFRKDVYSLYKSNRKEVRKPLVWKPLREHLHANYNVFERDHLEADDCLGILATRGLNADKEERIVLSLDKDLKTIPGKHYNWNKPDLGVVEVSREEADYFHMMQTLMGDTTDGYPGCQGIGPKKAEAILREALDPKIITPHDQRLMWEAVVAAFKKAELTEDFALQMARVARILRVEDYDFQNKCPILWTPPKGDSC
jgi:DNA polymerase-1